MPSQRELEQAIQDLESKAGRIKEKIVGLDAEIKDFSAEGVEKAEAEIAELRNAYYEIQARELLGEFDPKEKRAIEEKIQSAERRLKTDTDQLQNFVGIKQALDTELKRTQALVPQYQAALDRVEFEQLKLDRDRLSHDIDDCVHQLTDLFSRITHYNVHSVALATKILDREFRLKGYPNGNKVAGNGIDKAHQFAQPFDLNHVKNSFAENLSELIAQNLSR
jgi:predicted  nucleic acid-binding Zn-ribbon protein